VAQPLFARLARAEFETNEKRRQAKAMLREEIESITREEPSVRVSRELDAARIPHAPITPIEKVSELPFVAKKALHTITPDGRTVRLPPPAVWTSFLEERKGCLPFAPRYGEHTDAVLAEAGLAAGEIARLHGEGVVA
jgi:crotonobetainyl-CoA:carnitine CoA-transferase CaiB-like acyl-CoA transferase